jgi:6,7-dimethyl-8-ribityllumazine synthase
MNQTYPPKLSNETCAQRVAFLQAQWHSDIVGQARDAFLAEFTRQGLAAEQVDIFTVAGAYEIPLQAKLLAKSGRYGAIVAAGFVVDGGIYRHEFVAQAVIEGLMQVQLETEVPVMSVVLTPHHFHEHATHHDFFYRHFTSKGTEVAQACLSTMENLQAIRRLIDR